MDERTLTPHDRQITFGKYKGRKFSEVPTQYLLWFEANCFTQAEARKQRCRQELDRRQVEELNYSITDIEGIK